MSLGQLRIVLPLLSWDEDTHPGRRSVCEVLSRDIPLRKAHSYPKVPLRTHAHGLKECASHRTLTLFDVPRVVWSGTCDLTEVLLACFLMWPRPRSQQMLTVEGWGLDSCVVVAPDYWAQGHIDP